MKRRLLIVDDDPVARQDLNFAFEQEYDPSLASSGEKALRLVKDNHFDIALLDFRMPGMNGLELFLEIKKFQDDMVCIMLTAEANFNLAVEIIKQGAYYFVTKPYDIDDLRLLMKKGIEDRKLKRHIDVLTRDDAKTIDDLLIGKSKAILKLKEDIQMLKGKQVMVLIRGESGTGKEVVARAISRFAPQSEGGNSFLGINCAAIPETLIESELFGHEKGAFTGAQERKRGCFEVAGEGDLFLDEIGDVPLKLQKSLLRVLQEREVRRVGSEKNIPIACRVITATNRNLEELIEKGDFRDDLYQRLNVISLHLPPLRKRKEDLAELAKHLIVKLNKKLGLKTIGVSHEVMSRFLDYHWPGNIRELQNILERMMIFCKTEILTLDHLPDSIKEAVDQKSISSHANNLSGAIKEFEKNVIQKSLHENQGVIMRAAKKLGMPESTLRYRIQALEIGFKGFQQ